MKNCACTCVEGGLQVCQAGMQVSRCVRFMQHANLLASACHLSRGRRSSTRQVRRCGRGGIQPTWNEASPNDRRRSVDPCAEQTPTTAAQKRSAGEGRVAVRWRVAGLLRAGREVRIAGNAREKVCATVEEGEWRRPITGQLRAIVLWARLQRVPHDDTGTLPL